LAQGMQRRVVNRLLRGGVTMSGQSELGNPDKGTQDWEPVDERELRVRKKEKRIVTVEDCGKIIGKIVSPIEGDIFGPWRGAVYLMRD